MKYKLLDYQGKGFIVMGAHDFQHWQANLSRRFDDSGDAGHFHLHVRLEGQDRTYASVEEYLAQFEVRDISEEDAKVLTRLFSVDGDSHQAAWYGAHEVFQPLAGK